MKRKLKARSKNHWSKQGLKMTFLRKNCIWSCHQALAYHPLQNSTSIWFDKDWRKIWQKRQQTQQYAFRIAIKLWHTMTLQKPTPIQNAGLWNVEASMCTQNQSLDSMQITRFQELPMPCNHYLITHKIRSYTYDSWRPNAHYSSLLFHESNKNSCVAMNYAHVINLWTQN